MDLPADWSDKMHVPLTIQVNCIVNSSTGIVTCACWTCIYLLITHRAIKFSWRPGCPHFHVQTGFTRRLNMKVGGQPGGQPKFWGHASRPPCRNATGCVPSYTTAGAKTRRVLRARDAGVGVCDTRLSCWLQFAIRSSSA